MVGMVLVMSIISLLVSLLMVYANFKTHKLTHSSSVLTILAFLGLMFGAILILYYELTYQPQQMLFILGLYALLILGAWLYARVLVHCLRYIDGLSVSVLFHIKA